jgi:hypothetical protein
MDHTPSELGKPADYFSYLLRLWREGTGGGEWRASLHDPHTGERAGFGDLDELFAFLQRQIQTMPGIGEGQDRGCESR